MAWRGKGSTAPWLTVSKVTALLQPGDIGVNDLSEPQFPQL